MGAITPSYVIVNPSFIMPEMIMQQQQSSGAFELLATGDPMVRLGQGDLYAYIRKLEIRTKVAGGQAAGNQLPSVSLAASMISTPSYLFRARAEYDHHDMAAAGNWGFGLPEAQRLGMRQAIFQQLRTSLLYGTNPSQGEGIVNTNGATATTLPPDSNGNTTVVDYDNGQMAVFLLGVIQAIKTRTMQLGMGVTITITGPQRVLGQFEYQNIVQLTQFQREGAGSTNTAGVVKDMLDMNGDTIIWSYDDTLIGQGDAGSDLVIVTVPEIKTQQANGINTNEFAKLKPNLEANNIMLCDMAAPREIPTPLAGGAIDVLAELRSTSGWTVRPEGLTLVSMPYDA